MIVGDPERVITSPFGSIYSGACRGQSRTNNWQEADAARDGGEVVRRSRCRSSVAADCIFASHSSAFEERCGTRPCRSSTGRCILEALVSESAAERESRHAFRKYCSGIGPGAGKPVHRPAIERRDTREPEKVCRLAYGRRKRSAETIRARFPSADSE